MHDLYFVTFRNRCRGPIGPPDNLSIQLHGNALGIQPKQLDQVADTGAFGYFGLISVNDEGQLSPSGDFRLCSSNKVFQFAATGAGLRLDHNGCGSGAERRKR
jgi:hypothetical protein